MKLYALTCGWLTIPGEYLLPGSEFKKPIETSVGMFVIEHPRGVVLFDTGSAPETSANPVDYWGEQTATDFPYRVERDQIIDRQLKKLGIAIDDVHYIIFSHLHIDHAGGVRFFPDAEIIVNRAEVADALWPPEGFDDGGYNLRDLTPATGFSVRKVDGAGDLFGDGKICWTPTPGHTRGHLSLSVDLGRAGRFILPGDACFNHRARSRKTQPGEPIPEPARWRLSFDLIGDEIESGARPLYSHIPIDDYPATDDGIIVFE